MWVDKCWPTVMFADSNAKQNQETSIYNQNTKCCSYIAYRYHHDWLWLVFQGLRTKLSLAVLTATVISWSHWDDVWDSRSAVKAVAGMIDFRSQHNSTWKSPEMILCTWLGSFSWLAGGWQVFCHIWKGGPTADVGWDSTGLRWFYWRI